MRCNKCNIDLPDFYTKCPLCDSKTINEKPLIENILTAEFPKVKPEKKKVNALVVFLIVWLVCAVIGAFLYKTNSVIFNVLFCAPPVIWTLILRPVFIRQLYNGNYIVINLFSFNLTVLVVGLSFDMSNTYYTASFPIVALMIIFALLTYSFLRKETSFRAGPYCVLLALYNVIGAIALYLVTKENQLLWLVPLAVTVIIFILIYRNNPERTKEEIKAKFSIQ